MRFARVENGQIVAIYNREPMGQNVLPIVRTVPDFDPDYSYVREKPYQEWSVLDGKVEPTFEEVFFDLEQEKTRKLQTIKRMRKQYETGGFEVDLGAGPVRIGSDPGDQAKIVGAKAYTDQNPDAVIDWSIGDTWATIDAAAVTAIANALGAHVQATFRYAKAKEDEVRAVATLPELWAVRETRGWPGS